MENAPLGRDLLPLNISCVESSDFTYHKKFLLRMEFCFHFYLDAGVKEKNIESNKKISLLN